MEMSDSIPASRNNRIGREVCVRFILTATIFLILSAPCLQAQTAPQSYLFVAEPQAIEGFNINNTTGAIVAVPGSPFVNSNGPVAIATNSSAILLFSANSNGTISVFQIASTGALTEIAGSPFNISDGSLPGAIAVSVDGTVLYVALGISNANQNSGQIDSFNISGGNLTEIASLPAPAFPIGIVVSSTNIYVAGGNTVQVYGLQQNIPITGTFVALPSGNATAIVGNANFLFVSRVATGSSNGYIDSISLAGPLLVSSYDAELFTPVNNEALDSTLSVLYTNGGVFTVSSSGVLTLIQPAILSPGPSNPLVVDPTAPFLFQGDQALNQGNGPLVFPLQIGDGGTLVNSEPPLDLAGIPVALVVATGTAIPPALPAVVFEPTSVNFNPIQVGQSLTVQITLYSTGSAALETGNISLSGDSSFSITSNTCPAELAPRATCFVYVAFTPLQPGNFTASLNLVGSVNGSVPLSGDPPGPVPPPPTPSFTLTATPASVAVNPGSTASSQIVVVPANGFTGTVQYSCVDSIPLSTCAVTPTGVLSITTTSTSNLLPVAIVLSIGALLLIPARKRKAVLAASALLLLGACGSSSRSLTVQPTAPVGGGTSAGTYTVIVSGKSGAISQAVSVTLVVQ
jgi:hypothetical protein